MARDDIFRRLRSALGRPMPTGDDALALDDRLARPRPNLIPARGQGDPDSQRALFIAMVQESSGTIDEVDGMDDVPDAIAGFLARENLPSALTVASDPTLGAIPWDSRPLLEIKHGVADGATDVAVTSAYAGIAETGTLMTLSGPDHPTTLNFLPDSHIVVLPAGRIIGDYEDGWSRLRGACDDGQFMPRTVNMITGPSRTGDIEQKIQLGAHGPRRLHVVLVRDVESVPQV